MNNLNKHVFPYRWSIKDGYPAATIPLHKKKVFTTFSCGGGSSMGYKLAGYDVIAANDIDNEMRNVYIANHHPKYYLFSDVRKLLEKDYPEAFYNLDILDGSPPCSTFSMAGLREDAWGKEKKFREGQQVQTLDDLFFDFIALAKKLQPKVIIAENVKGLLQGAARGYYLQIFEKFEEAGYKTQSFLFNAASMGVPQRRERVFFLCARKDLNLPLLQMDFQEDPIYFEEIYEKDSKERPLQPKEQLLWNHKRFGDSSLANVHERLFGKPNYFKAGIVKKNIVPHTIIAGDALVLDDEPRHLSKKEMCLIGSFPLDYNFLNLQPEYVIGMSVPPVMTAHVSYQIYLQWLSKI